MKITKEVLSKGEWINDDIFRYQHSTRKSLYRKIKCFNCGEDCLIFPAKKTEGCCSLQCARQYYDKFKDLTNKKFNRLTPLYRTRMNNENGWMWMCQCDCGNMKEIRGSKILSGHTKSCGCLNIETYTKGSGYKHGLLKKGLKIQYASYDTYAERLNRYEDTRRNKENPAILECRCKYCGKWIMISSVQAGRRLGYINGTIPYESNFYCEGDECRNSCSIFKRQKYPKGFKNIQDLTREVQPELRKMVFERDGYQCLKCKSTEELHCHHIEGILYNPIESADIDLCMTVCKSCHVEIHHEDGCTYYDMQCHEASQ